MTLGEIIRQYRMEHGMSQRDFAKQCGMSNAYISMLENNRNTKTGLPVVPSLETIKTAADTMGVTLTSMLEMLGDAPLSLDTQNAPAEEPERDRITKLFLSLTEENQKKLIDYAILLLTAQQAGRDSQG